MTTFLYSILTAGAEKMLQNDPHGWILTLVCVSVVFIALFILWGLYSISGAINTGKIKLRRKHNPDAETAAAIALALHSFGSEDEAAAVALALHLYLGGSAHDIESGIITIESKDSAWNNKSLTFRKKP